MNVYCKHPSVTVAWIGLAGTVLGKLLDAWLKEREAKRAHGGK